MFYLLKNHVSVLPAIKSPFESHMEPYFNGVALFLNNNHMYPFRRYYMTIIPNEISKPL